MIRRTKINLNYATQVKIDQLDLILIEFKRVVNIYIAELWQKPLSKFVNFKVDTWLSARMQQAAGKTAIQIIKSVRKKDKDKRYRHFKKVFSYFKKQKRQITFLSKRFSELQLNYKIKPEYTANVIELDSRFIEIQFGENSFDIWLKLGSIGSKIKLLLPSKKHQHFRKYQSWLMKKSVRIYKNSKGYFADIFFEKPAPEPKKTGGVVGLDIGVNKVLSLSYDEQYGSRIKELINKLNHRKQKSKNWFQTIQEIKNYIREQCNKIDLTNISVLVIEDLTSLKNNNVNKTTRKLLGYWNRMLLKRKLEMLCQENRILLATINPAYTSQTCRSCGHISKSNRSGERFKCVKCAYVANADILASLNIADRYRQSIVACA